MARDDLPAYIESDTNESRAADSRARKFLRDGQQKQMSQPPSKMTAEMRQFYNAPDALGGYSKGGKVKKVARITKSNKGTAKVTKPKRK
ncbi:MAG TPA: hypothetical protein VNU68_34935 [Verrucomicrobiae bacterium]|nr:hypothetical protein [Verrucomicrobiae bacterium]